MWYDDAHRRLHREASDRRARKDSTALWPVGRALSSRPALGQAPRYGLRLRASATGGAVAVAPRARRGSRSAVNCTLDSRRDRHFQPQWPPGPAFLETTTAFGGWRAAAHQPPRRPAKHLQGTILPRFALNGHTQPGTLQPRRKSKLLLVTGSAIRDSSSTSRLPISRWARRR